jgi:hypothetical protein
MTKRKRRPKGVTTCKICEEEPRHLTSPYCRACLTEFNTKYKRKYAAKRRLLSGKPPAKQRRPNGVTTCKVCEKEPRYFTGARCRACLTEYQRQRREEKRLLSGKTQARRAPHLTECQQQQREEKRLLIEYRRQQREEAKLLREKQPPKRKRRPRGVTTCATCEVNPRHLKSSYCSACLVEYRLKHKAPTIAQALLKRRAARQEPKEDIRTIVERIRAS